MLPFVGQKNEAARLSRPRQDGVCRDIQKEDFNGKSIRNNRERCLKEFGTA